MKIHSAVFIKSATRPEEYPAHEYPEIAFAGRSNVGKSSLINCLAQRRTLAKTSNTPGRTRLLNFFLINEAMVFVDLPGYGFAKISAQIKNEWGQMMEIYLSGRSNLKGVVIVADVRREPSKDDLSFAKWLKDSGIAVIVVITKIDKFSNNQRRGRIDRLCAAWEEIAGDIIPLSSLTREGRDALWRRITQKTGHA